MHKSNLNVKITLVNGMKLCEKLKILRKNKGLNQTEVAQVIGVEQTTYSKYEKERVCPDIFVIKKLANLYGITIDQLVDDVDEEKTIIAITPEERKVLNNLVHKINTIENLKIESNINISNNTNVHIGVINKNDEFNK